MGPRLGIEVLLDSVIVIDHLNRLAGASAYLAHVRERAAISVITRAETLAGYPEKEQGDIRQLLDRFPTLSVDAEIGDLAALLRREHRWKIPDAFQAAIAQYHGLRLATRNTHDFPEERFPFVLVPYRL
jgi:predicted nucleic acid-binding protein